MRCFVAIDVGDAVRREVTRVIATLTGKLEAVKTPPKVAWVKPVSLHVTVRFLGEMEPAAVERLQEVLAPAIALAPFETEWRGIGSFPNNKHPRALWIGVVTGAAPLAQLEAEISRRIAGGSVADLGDRPFLAHLTLGRVKMAGAGVDWPRILQAVEVKRVTTIVDRVTLYRSELSRGGPHYTGLVSAPLIGTAK
ncbi:MAG: RNA 2',3'-cyclic phosphodiesterase [Vicinamibacterales bacterium]